MNPEAIKKIRNASYILLKLNSIKQKKYFLNKKKPAC